ncbi:probable periplasmic serine endoprotease DegP-like [Arthrobacter sp. Hiyo6]|nr:probable periplasmic serine endoprotease DegP-like [Arthrobacter sp. Hiyo6]
MVKDGPADKAGIKPGDVLISLDGKELGSAEDLLSALRNANPKQTVNVEYRRGTDKREAKVTLSDRPAQG